MEKTSIKSNFIFNALYQLSEIVLPIITFPYLARVLHAQGLGEYSFAHSVAYCFYLFIRLGLHNYGNRTIASIKDDAQVLSKVFCEIYAFQFLSGVVISALYVCYCILFAPVKEIAYIFLLFVISEGVDLTWALYGLEEFKVSSIRDIATKILTAACVFIFVKDEDDILKYSLIYCVWILVSQIITFPVVLRRIKLVIPKKKGVISHIKPNIVLFLPTIAVSLYKIMDKIMLGNMSNDIELGYYHSSENIIKVPLALSTALGMVMLPRMTNMLSVGKKDAEIESIFHKSILFAMFVSTATSLGIMTVAKEFVPLFFGVGFEKCVVIFNIILPSCIFLAFANVIRTQYLLPRSLDKIYIVSLFIGAGVNVLLNLCLIPRFESVGASIGTLVAEIVVCICQAIFVFNEAKIGKNVLTSLPFLLSGIAMYYIFRDFSPNIDNLIVALLVKIAVCGAFYTVASGISLGVMILLISRIKG